MHQLRPAEEYIGKVTSTSWDGLDEMTFDEWYKVGVTLQAIGFSLNWWVGDWLNYGEAEYGETFAQGVEVTGWAIQRLKDAKWVASQVPRENRFEDLSWTHHRHVAHMEPDDQRKWLKKALDNEWSSAELRGVISSSKKSGEEGDEETIIMTPEGETEPIHMLLNSSKEVEYYTPPVFADASREVMGGIDLDPASCLEANQFIKADKIYTKDNDGLLLPWHGRVFINPPYGRRDGQSNQGLWTARLIDAYESGEIEQGVALINAHTGTAWFQRLWDYPICFYEGRIKFLGKEGHVYDQPTHDNAFFYVGPNTRRFMEEFNQFGVIAGKLYP